MVGVTALGRALLATFHSPNRLRVSGLMGAHLIQASFAGPFPVMMMRKIAGTPAKGGFS